MSSSSIATSERSHQDSSVLRGQSSQEAAECLSKYGPNPAPVKRGAAVIELLLLFVNPLVVILLIASVLSFILGNATDAVIILVMVLLGFTPLPGPFFTFLAISTVTYLLLVERAKRLLFSRPEA